MKKILFTCIFLLCGTLFAQNYYEIPMERKTVGFSRENNLWVISIYQYPFLVSVNKEYFRKQVKLAF